MCLQSGNPGYPSTGSAASGHGEQSVSVNRRICATYLLSLFGILVTGRDCIEDDRATHISIIQNTASKLTVGSIPNVRTLKSRFGVFHERGLIPLLGPWMRVMKKLFEE